MKMATKSGELAAKANTILAKTDANLPVVGEHVKHRVVEKRQEFAEVPAKTNTNSSKPPKQ